MSKNLIIFVEILIKKMKYLLLFGSLFLSTLSLAQTISGKISAKNGEEIPYANVYLKQTKMGTSTNENGFYELKMYQKISIH